MRKQILDTKTPETLSAEPVWLDLERLARVELSSEEAAHPVEATLIPGDTRGWRAMHPGEQTIRLLHIRLSFTETEHERTQEFVLKWSGDGGRTYREIVRQQYHFSPPDTTRELEDFRIELDGVGALELQIVPDISRGPACATLEQFRLA
jgi:hypothetical protein